MKKILLSLFLAFSVQANDIEDKIHKMMWDGIEVTWLEDDRFPTYDVIFYFADGALSDGPRKGETNTMFNLLQTGTNRFSLKEIADNLDFYGASVGGKSVHEYSTYAVSGLSKDIIPTMKKVCHLFKDSIFPSKEVAKFKRATISGRKNLINSHGKLASMAFREISLTGSPFSHPVSGKIKTVKKIKSKHLQNKLKYFNEKVKKKIYISGPKTALNIKNIVLNECGWNTKADYERKVSYKYKKRKPLIHLITVPKANQAQVAMGKFLSPGEFDNFETLGLAGHYLGGGFTSVLMSELRVKRGLTYSAYAYAGGQKDYGRAVISTFTKVKTIEELLSVTKNVLKEKGEGKITKEELLTVKKSLKGGFPFQFESTSSFIKELLFLDHVGHSYKRFFNYNKTLDSATVEDIAKTLRTVFPYDGIEVVVLGQKNLEKKLRKLGTVKVHSYKKFL
jgi:zinc protease